MDLTNACNFSTFIRPLTIYSVVPFYTLGDEYVGEWEKTRGLAIVLARDIVARHPEVTTTKFDFDDAGHSVFVTAESQDTDALYAFLRDLYEVGFCTGIF